MSNLIIFEAPNNNSTVLTMSSREIAELTSKNHKHVIRDIQIMLSALGNDGPDLDHPKNQGLRIVRDNRNYISEIYLPKHECLTIVSGYNIVLRHRIIGRWQELETQIAEKAIKLPDFTNPATAARAWADQFERALMAEQQTEKLLAENATLAPKAMVFDALCNAEGDYTITAAAKNLGTGPQKLNQALVVRGHFCRNKLPMQRHITAGHFVVRTHEIDEVMRKQVYVTAKGMIWLGKHKGELITAINETAPLRKRKAA